MDFFKYDFYFYKTRMLLYIIRARINELIAQERSLMDRLQFEIDPDYMATYEVRKLGRKIEKKLQLVLQELEELEEQEYLLSINEK